MIPDIFNKQAWNKFIKTQRDESQSLIEISDDFSDITFDGYDFYNIRFTGNFENVTFKNCYFNTEFSGYSMMNCVFDPNNEIRKIVLSVSIIISSDFSELTFGNFVSVGSSFHECLFINSIFEDGRIENATIMDSDFNNCTFRLMDISDSRFAHNDMTSVVFDMLYMCDVKISNGVLNNSHFIGCCLEDVDINHLDMFDSNIDTTNVANVIFDHVVLVNTLFNKLFLRGNVRFNRANYSDIKIHNVTDNDYKFIFKDSYGYHNDVDFTVESIGNRWPKHEQ